ncbi:MAG: right-handed parallel beta-helix repeat-containing protein [Thermoplasmata archaeon]|nr:right-handed parallel beta-helix repeat-containing protein [Thermoplasmata archaeon]
MFKKISSLLIVVATIVATLFVGISYLSSATEESSYSIMYYDWDIVVPDDYPAIQEAIDHSSDGYRIFVRSGIYKGRILINKKNLLIQGENKFTTIIDGERLTKDAVINVSASNVTIQGFTVQNGWCKEEIYWDASGIKVFSSNVTIRDNVISFNRLGITAATDIVNLTIINNIFIDDGILPGCYVYNGKLSKEDFLCEISNNTVNGKPLYYYKNMHDFTAPKDAGQIILANCTNVTIRDVYISHTDFSIILGFCSNCLIENSTITKTDGELILLNSNSNIIQNNTISYTLHGICLDFNSSDNIVRYNDISNSWVGISALTSSNNNHIYGNIIHDNAAGFLLDALIPGMKAHDNEISENKIFNNNVGIQLQGNSFNNIIQRNNISKNKCGVLLKYSDGNVIKNNYFRRNFLFSALFMGCSQNTWEYNYWNRPRILPKIIIGYRVTGKMLVPWINIDKHPLKLSTII